MTEGRYLVLEGPDGCGKSEQARRLVARLREAGREVVHVREPGSTPVGETLRELLLAPATGELAPLTEALLFYAARAELLRREIGPARGRGAVVVAERCYLSTMVYQGHAPADGAGAPADLLRALTAAVHTDGPAPDRILVLDVDFETSRSRRAGAAADRIEARGASYHQRVRESFVALAGADDRIEVVDGAGTPDAVHERVMGLVRPVLEGSR